jgi:hypothetical protein
MSQPVPVSPLGVDASSPAVAVGQSGRTVVMWAAYYRRQAFLQARVGPSAARLGPARAIDSWGDYYRVVVTADERVVACWETEHYRKPTHIRCATALAGHSFGKPHTLDTPNVKLGDLVGTAQGRVLAALTYRPRGESSQVGWVEIDTSGRPGPIRHLGTTRRGDGVDLATDSLGTVLAAWQPTAFEEPDLLALLRPGARAFQPPSDTGPGYSDLGVFGGQSLSALIRDTQNRITAVRINPDGTRQEPVELPRDPRPHTFPNVVATSIAGSLVVLIGSTASSSSDCSNDTDGQVSSSQLAPAARAFAKTTLLSDPTQIAEGPSLMPAPGGRLLASWTDLVNENGAQITEYSLRSPTGKWAPAVALARHGGFWADAAGSESGAVLAWATVRPHPRIMLSHYTTHAPGPSVARPKHPVAGCA